MFLITSCQKSTGTDKETDRRQKEEEERGRRREKKSQPLSILCSRLKCFTCARVCPLPPGRWLWSSAVPLLLCFPKPLRAPAAELQPPSLLPRPFQVNPASIPRLVPPKSPLWNRRRLLSPLATSLLHAFLSSSFPPPLGILMQAGVSH